VLEAAAPEALFEARVPTDTFVYAGAADGKRLLVNTGSQTAAAPLTVVVNWLAAVRK
jgi:hypothetical protein